MSNTGLIDTRPKKTGDVLKSEYDPSYCRKAVTVTVTSTMEQGAVLESTSVPGKYTLVALITTANADGVLIDPEVNFAKATPGDYTLAVLVDGPAEVADLALSYNADVNDDAKKLAVITALETNTGIKALNQV